MLTLTDEYSTGIAALDADHRKLIDTLNRLEAALNQGRGSNEILPILEFLQRYAIIHFSREESCMNRLNCPVAAKNEAEHHRFIAQMADAHERLKASSGSGALVARQVHRELTDWVANHILRTDCEIRRCT